MDRQSSKYLCFAFVWRYICRRKPFVFSFPFLSSPLLFSQGDLSYLASSIASFHLFFFHFLLSYPPYQISIAHSILFSILFRPFHHSTSPLYQVSLHNSPLRYPFPPLSFLLLSTGIGGVFRGIQRSSSLSILFSIHLPQLCVF